MSLVLTNLGFTYPRSRYPAVSKFSATFDGNVVAVLGPNGAGKTTLLKMLVTHTRPTTGSFVVGGIDPSLSGARDDLRRRLGWMPQHLRMFGSYTASEFLRYVAWMREVPRENVPEAVGRALSLVNLSDVADSRAKTLSGGMRQRLGLAQAVVNSPAIVVLDEPTVGLDPEQRSEFRSVLAALAPASQIILSTHLVDDVAYLADEVLVMDHGGVRFSGTLHAMCGRQPGSAVSGEDVERAYLALMRSSR